jgi:hypothetical protein
MLHELLTVLEVSHGCPGAESLPYSQLQVVLNMQAAGSS